MKRALLLMCSIGLVGPAWAQTPPNYQAIWSNASESGWGLTVAHQGDVLFPAWFTYNAAGRVQWYTVSGASRQADGAYTGEVFRFNGRAFNLINGQQAFTSSSKVGTATLRFTGNSALSFNYTVDGITQTKALTRFNFATPPTCSFTTGSRVTASNFSDIWNVASESGWGVSLDHQGDLIFAAWYTYDANGNPQWITGLATKGADGKFRGDLNRPNSGTAFNQIAGSAATSFPIPKVGELELTFSDGETGIFKYRLDNIEQSKNIRRFVFSSPTTLCTVASSGGGGTGGGGTASGCYRAPKVGDVTTSRLTQIGTTTPAANQTERVVSTGIFDGQTVQFSDSFDAQNRRTARTYQRVNASTVDILAVDGYDAATGVLSSRTRFSPVQQFPLTPPTTTFESRYTGTQELFALGQTFNIQYVSRLTRLPDEAVSAPIGSFSSACKIQSETETTTSVAGFSIVTSTKGPQWATPSVGTIKSDLSTTTSTGPTQSTRSVLELVSFQGGN